MTDTVRSREAGRRSRRPGVVLSVVVAVLAVVAASCTSARASETGNQGPGGLYGSLPADSGAPRQGGTVTIGQIAGSTADYIFPVTPAAEASSFNIGFFQDLMWTPLYWYPTGTRPQFDPSLSLAGPPTFSDGDRTVTIQMDANYHWSDGRPVDARDVEFFIDLAKAAVSEGAANWNSYTPGFLPDNVASVSTPGTYTVVLHLTHPYNPAYFYQDQLNLLVPLPSHAWSVDRQGGPVVDFTVPAEAKAVYDFLGGQAKDVATYATNPLWQVVDGPMRLISYTPSTGAYAMAPNQEFDGPRKATVDLRAETFTSQQAQFDQLLAGNLDIGSQLDYADLPQFGSLRSGGYSVYGYPEYGFHAAFLDFKDSTDDFGRVVSQLYVRQALAHLVDQPAIVSGVLDGAATESYGPVPALPPNPYTPGDAQSDPYPYSIKAAAQLLSSHGWKVVPGGQTVCTDAGTAPGRCGAGIPAGTKLAFTWVYANTPAALGQISTAFAAAARQVGITVTLDQQPWQQAVSDFNDPAAPSNASKWGANFFGAVSNSPYPTTNSVFNTQGSMNLGGYSSRQADADIAASVTGTSPQAVTQEASFLTTDLPALFMPNPDTFFAVKKGLEGPASSWAVLTQGYATPEFWYFTGP